MKLHFRILLILLIPVLIPQGVFSQERDVTKTGTTAAPFLTISVGARAMGMGGAFVSIANDASALFWNVSGISQINQPAIIFNHSEWIADINFDYLGVTFPIPGVGTLGASFTSVNMDEMEVTNELNPEGTGIFFDVSSFAASVSFGRQLTDRFMIGFSGKYVRENIWNSSATGIAIDVGTLFITPFNGLRLGMSISNFGSKMQISGDDLTIQVDPDQTISGNNETIPARFETGRFDLPLLFRVGLSMDVLKSELNRVTLAVDALHPNDNNESVNIGGEYMFKDLIAFRGGYRSLFLKDSEEGFTVGGGLNHRLSGVGFRLDYAYEDFGRLENIQKFTIQLMF